MLNTASEMTSLRFAFDAASAAASDAACANTSLRVLMSSRLPW